VITPCLSSLQHTVIYVYKNFVRKEIHQFKTGYAKLFGVKLADLQVTGV
jgi:hypothetical protein